MSLPRHRTRSANILHRTGVNAEVVLLQDTVEQLQQHLLHSQNETKKVKEQLNCLITLVKQAWTGDQAAVMHVANIVGVAAPDITHDHTQLVITAKPKSRAVNNWARLTIGLLNREYCLLERDQEERQRHYLLNRQSFLAGQVERGYQKPVNNNQWQIIAPTTQPPPTPVPSQNGHSQPSSTHNTSPESNTQSATRRPKIHHLYRPANQKPGLRANNNANMTWGDLVPGQDEECLLNKMNKQRVGGDQYNRHAISYIDPHRYNKHGLYHENTVVGDDPSNNQRRRPASCKQQRQSDNLRSRPRSAVLPQGERPMKYETTRPVSSSIRRTGPLAFGRRASTGDLRSRPQSHKVTERPQSHKGNDRKTFLTNNNEDENQHENSMNDTENQPPHRVPQDVDSEDDTPDSGAEDREKRRREANAIMVQIKKPDSVIKFEGDLAHMEEMEDTFKLKTLELQKKLGISPEGLVL